MNDLNVDDLTSMNPSGFDCHSRSGQREDGIHTSRATATSGVRWIALPATREYPRRAASVGFQHIFGSGKDGDARRRDQILASAEPAGKHRLAQHHLSAGLPNHRRGT